MGDMEKNCDGHVKNTFHILNVVWHFLMDHRIFVLFCFFCFTSRINRNSDLSLVCFEFIFSLQNAEKNDANWFISAIILVISKTNVIDSLEMSMKSILKREIKTYRRLYRCFSCQILQGKNTILKKLFNIFPIDKSKLFSSGNFVEQFPWNVIRYQAYAET